MLVSGFTASNVNDCEAFNDMSNDLRGNIASVRADAAYDTYKIYKQIHQWGAKAIIPPGNRAKAQDELKQKVKIKDYLEQRDKVIHSIRKHNNFEEGLQEWKKESQYHKRSLIEAFMYRFKSIFGFSLHNRSERGRRNEIKAKLTLLNLMTSLGMAEYF